MAQGSRRETELAVLVCRLHRLVTQSGDPCRAVVGAQLVLQAHIRCEVEGLSVVHDCLRVVWMGLHDAVLQGGVCLLVEELDVYGLYANVHVLNVDCFGSCSLGADDGGLRFSMHDVVTTSLWRGQAHLHNFKFGNIMLY